jgi:hypothetical protein
MLRLSMHTRLERHHRAKCQSCRLPRIVYSIVSESPGGAGRAESPRLCAACAGIREGAEPLSIDDALAATEMLPVPPGLRRVLIDEAFVDAMLAAATADGRTITWEWDSPTADGFYYPVLTEHTGPLPELPPSPTFHTEVEDGVSRPVLDGPLPSPVVGEDDES